MTLARLTLTKLQARSSSNPANRKEQSWGCVSSTRLQPPKASLLPSEASPLGQLSHVTIVCIPVTIANNFLQSPFQESNSQNKLKQKRLSLSHNARTNCHNPKIDFQKPSSPHFCQYHAPPQNAARQSHHYPTALTNEKVIFNENRLSSGEVMKETVNTENAPKPAGPYNQAVKAGKLLYVSGQLAIDPKLGQTHKRRHQNANHPSPGKHQSDIGSRRLRLSRHRPNKRLPLLHGVIQRIQHSLCPVFPQGFSSQSNHRRKLAVWGARGNLGSSLQRIGGCSHKL